MIKKTIEEFLFRVEFLRARNQVSEGELLATIHSLLKDEANTWYWNHMFQSRGNDNWQTFAQAMSKQFKDYKDDNDIRLEIIERRQRANESVEEFFQDIFWLRSRLQEPISDSSLVKIIKRNLKDNIANRIYAKTIYSLEHLRDECKEAEGFNKRRSRTYAELGNRRGDRYHVNEIVNSDGFQEEPYDEEVCALRGPSKTVRNRCPHECPTCIDQELRQKNGEAEKYCYRCKHPGVTVSNCPNCRAENQERNAITAGRPRSTTNPPPQAEN